MYGTKFSGIPFGSSPINDDSCAPIGLKYLRLIPLIFLFITISFLIISSQIFFDSPYGDSCLTTGLDSLIGNFLACPYTVQLELKIKLVFLFLDAIKSSRFFVASTLFVRYSSGFFTLSETDFNAAK